MVMHEMRWEKAASSLLSAIPIFFFFSFSSLSQIRNQMQYPFRIFTIRWWVRWIVTITLFDSHTNNLHWFILMWAPNWINNFFFFFHVNYCKMSLRCVKTHSSWIDDCLRNFLRKLMKITYFIEKNWVCFCVYRE